MSSNRRVLLAAGLVALAACAHPTGPSADDLRTDSTAYTAVSDGFGQFHVTVVLTYQNSAGSEVDLERCGPDISYPIYSVDMVRPASADGAAYNPNWACVGGAQPFVIPPLGMRVDTIVLRGPSVYDEGSNRYLGVLAGTFRIAYGGQRSNEFTITVPPGTAP